jgi:hypothetical protein
MTAAQAPSAQATPEQQLAFQSALGMQAAVQSEGFFDAGHPFPWAPPGAPFWQAVLAARKAKRSLEKVHEGPPNKKAKKEDWVNKEVVDKRTGEVRVELVPPPAFMYVSADDYVCELDRACLDNDVVVLPSNTVEDTGGGGRKLAASYYVAHAGTGQGLVLRCDVPISGGGGMGDPTKKAYTDSLAMFVRGFLGIPRTDAPEEEDSLPPQPHVPPGGFRGPPQNMGPPPGYQGPPPGYQGGPPAPQGMPPSQGQFRGGPVPNAPQQQFQQRRPGAGGAPFGAGGPPQGPRGQGGFPQGAPPPHRQDQGGHGFAGGGPHGGSPRGMVGGPPAQPFQGQGQHQQQQQQRQPPPQGMNGGGRPPVHQEPVVQHAQAMLGQHAPEPSDADLSAPPPPARAQPLRGSRPGEPQTMDDWVQVLVGNGWPEDQAIMLAGHKPDEPISVALRERVVRDARPNFPTNEAMVAAFVDTGFTPQPQLSKDLRPRPTGLQTLRFLSKITKVTNNPAATATS